MPTNANSEKSLNFRATVAILSLTDCVTYDTHRRLNGLPSAKWDMGYLAPEEEFTYE